MTITEGTQQIIAATLGTFAILVFVIFFFETLGYIFRLAFSQAVFDNARSSMVRLWRRWRG